MKITCFIVLNIFLMIRFGQCQIDPGNEISFKEYKFTIPQKDSSLLKFRSIPYEFNDSTGTGGILRRNPGQKPDSANQRFNDEMIVIDPRPIRDKMPNANVAVPGVHYHLKIKGFKKSSTNPRGKFR